MFDIVKQKHIGTLELTIENASELIENASVQM